MRRIRRIMFVSMLGLTAPGLAHADAHKPHAKQAPTRQDSTKQARKVKPQKPQKMTPVSAEHKKALAELYGGFKFGMTKDEVITVFSKQLDERYDEKIKATTDITAQDRLRRDKKNEVNRLQTSYTSFDSSQPSPWDVSIVEEEFAHNTNEAMLERWENQSGKNQRRFFFFFQGKLWKMFVSLDVSIIPEDKRNFATFQAVMEGKYGPGDVESGKITWRTPEFQVRAVDKLKSYDALALIIEDPRARNEVDAIREAKAPPRRETNPVIKAVLDTDHSDHPDVKSNSNAVDDVIRAQGGTQGAAKNGSKN
ncbi:MAG TPA: hypothetical protein VHN14_10490 [Kofleriaceae bacterium]|jgi:hypothetical protein|nr:hypothetical protein [Kofleriaceae bacterium]